MSQRIRLLLVVPHLGGGGAERVTAQLARHLSPDRFEIHLCLIIADSPGAPLIPLWVQVHRLHRTHVRNAWFQLITLIRALRPDVLLSNMAHLNFLILLLRPFLPRRTRVLVRQNSTASSAAKSWQTRIAYRCLYPKADVVICQSQAMATDLETSFAIPPAKLAVLLNPLDTGAIRAANLATNQSTAEDGLWPQNSWPRLLTVGRLSPEKGIDLLLAAIFEIKPKYPQLHLTMLGTGHAEAGLKSLARELNIENAVSFAGHQENPADFYSGATLFILPSRHEGMPNALLEAAAGGLPLVATPCCAGLADLLVNSPGTWMSEAITAHSLAETVLTALQTFVGREDTPSRYRHGFLAPFELETAIAAYTQLIERAAQAKP